MQGAAQVRYRAAVGGVADQPPYDRAWLVLLGASLCMFSGTPAVLYYPFGIFLSEIIADTHWSKALVASAIGVGTLVSALTVPVIGRLSDRFGVRVLAAVGGPAFALGLALLGLASNSARSFALWTMVLWVLAFAGSPVPYAQALTGWFDRRRGMAISVMFCSGALGIAAWPPFAGYLVSHFGWRTAYAVMGACAGAVIGLSGLLLLKNPPAQRSASTASGDADGLTARDAVRTIRFWKTAAVFLLLTAVLGGLAVNLPIILRQHHASAQTAAAVMSVVGVGMFAGRVALWLVLDRCFAPRLTAAIMAAPMLAVALMMATSSTLALFAAAGCLGFGLGSEYAVAAYVVSRQFGVRAYGAIYGLMTLTTAIGGALGPSVIGASLATGIGASAVLPAALGLMALAVAILLTMRRDELPFVVRGR